MYYKEIWSLTDDEGIEKFLSHFSNLMRVQLRANKYQVVCITQTDNSGFIIGPDTEQSNNEADIIVKALNGEFNE